MARLTTAELDALDRLVDDMIASGLPANRAEFLAAAIRRYVDAILEEKDKS